MNRRFLWIGMTDPKSTRYETTHWKYAILCAFCKWSGHIGLQPVVVCTAHQGLQS